MSREVNKDKFVAVAQLNAGDKVLLTNGKVYEYIRLKQKKFIGKSVDDGGNYDIPVNMFVEVVEKASQTGGTTTTQARLPQTPARASINGITLKGLKQWNTHDGGGYQADVYIDNRRIGYVHNDGNGGSSDVRIESSYNDSFNSRMQSYFKAFPSQYPDSEIFLEELVNLTDNEKVFKKNYNKGFLIFALLWKAPRSQTLINDRYINSPTQMSLRDEEVLKNVMKKDGYVDTQVFRSVDDFCINTMVAQAPTSAPTTQKKEDQPKSENNASPQSDMKSRYWC